MYSEDSGGYVAPGADTRFHHGDGDRPPDHGPLGAITRCLSGAVYTVPGFADRVISGIVKDRHRAVSPTIDYDLEPVLRHAFRARRLWLVQHALVCAVLVLSLLFATGPTIGLICFAVLLTIGGHLLGGSRPTGWRLWAAGAAAVLLLLCIGRPLLESFGQAWSAAGLPGAGLTGAGTGTEYTGGYDEGVYYDEQGYPIAAPAEESQWGPYLWAALIGAMVLGVVVGVRTVMLRTLTMDLRPGGDDRGGPVSSAAIEQRIARVARAQHGNILMHSGYNPFLGAGGVQHAWSLALELRPEETDDEPRHGVRTAVAIDPLELNRHVKQRLAALRATELREAERMSGLTLRDQVVSAGVGGQGWPLVDTTALVPWSHATPAAMTSVIRHPQASVRHFLRATVGANVTPVRSADGRMLIPGEHHGVTVSTFTHIAVEGGMLYLETVSTVLGPLKPRYRRIDDYPAGSPRVAGRALLESVRDLGESVVLAPVRLVGGLSRMAGLARALNDTDTQINDFGARYDVRQLASHARPVTYLQRLDAEKYTKLIERRISEAVVGYLRDQGIDTSEFETRMNVYNNSGVVIHGDNNGAAAGGDGASAVHQEERPAKSKGKGKDD